MAVHVSSAVVVCQEVNDLSIGLVSQGCNKSTVENADPAVRRVLQSLLSQPKEISPWAWRTGKVPCTCATGLNGVDMRMTALGVNVDRAAAGGAPVVVVVVVVAGWPELRL